MSLTVLREERGFRAVWLLEEMGLACRLRPVDLHAEAERLQRKDSMARLFG